MIYVVAVNEQFARAAADGAGLAPSEFTYVYSWRQLRGVGSLARPVDVWLMKGWETGPCQNEKFKSDLATLVSRGRARLISLEFDETSGEFIRVPAEQE